MIELKTDYQDGEKRQIQVVYACTGDTNALIDELAAGAARILVDIADDLPPMDELHESLARVFSSTVMGNVGRILIARGDENAEAEDRQADAYDWGGTEDARRSEAGHH